MSLARGTKLLWSGKQSYFGQGNKVALARKNKVAFAKETKLL